MEDPLVTLAIHTFEKAQILKTILESEGIEACIHNINQIQPVISAGVRVRIRESDLPHALRIIEDTKWLNNSTENKFPESAAKQILIPTNFSEYSLKVCEIGIHYAHRTGAEEVMFLHVYFNAYIPPSFPFVSEILIDKEEEKNASLRSAHLQAVEQMEKWCASIERKMTSGELPRVKYDYTLLEGLPETEIRLYAREYGPSLIVMGTRGSKHKDLDIVGSVTGEIIELTDIPLLTVPAQVPFTNLYDMKRLAFALSFNQRDLVAFDKFASYFKTYPHVEIQLFNISTSKNEWNEIRLGGFHAYLKKQYPGLTFHYTVLDDGDLLDTIERFVENHQIDMIACSTYRRSMIMRIFYPSIARRMLFHSNTPLLVIPI
ncbi:MAG: universal stress protein [Tannerella sp.]|jgi:nucleotide-binding universal stress UspA family protein|nr:universal stress protein [Tannerella sp.]